MRDWEIGRSRRKERSKGRRVIIIVCLLAAILLITLSAPILYWKYRSPSDIDIADSLYLETWNAIPPDAHHFNTELTKFNGQYLLAHATSPWHFASPKCRMVVRSSQDGKSWKVLREIQVPGEDVRDPKLLVIKDKVFLYFLRNTVFEPKPFQTSYCVSEDGVTWSEPKDLPIEGWLLGRPKTFDGVTFYAPAWWGYTKSMLFKTTDGIEWHEVGPIYGGDTSDETGIEFRPDGAMVMTARIQVDPNYWGYDPEGHTLIGISYPPYKDWQLRRSYATRLDGPRLFQIGERTYVCSRRHIGGASDMGSVWASKRTSLYLVMPDRLVFLSDLPSCGDTGYAGVVVDDENVLISYYTGPPGRDYIWLLGMLSDSSIEMARFRMTDLNNLASAKLAQQ